MSIHTKTIAQLSQGLNSGEFSSVELTQHYLDRINASDLNAFITVTDELAMKQAQAADDKIAKGAGGILTGIPYAHKDIFCTNGVKTSAGSKMLDNFISPYDATVSHKLNQADLVMLGKANMDEFAMGSSNENSYYGDVKNPWNINKIPGGSSGGSAAAVAGRLAPFATGTDTGGSIRQPSSLCGITGLKPTYGRVSRYGMIAYASSLDQAGPMTQTAEDAALVLNVMAGFDEKDSTSAQRDVEDYTASLNDSIKGLTIGLPKEFFSEGLDGEVASQVMAAVKEFEAMGATVKEVSLPNSAYAIPTYYIVAPCECSSNLSRLDGVRYGYRCENPKDLEDLYLRSRVFLLHVVHEPADTAGFYFPHISLDKLHEDMKKGAEKIMRKLVLDTMGTYDNFETAIISGTPYRKVAQFAGENDIDIIVMGAVGRTGLDRVFYGSTVDKVIKFSEIPVLAVKTPLV